MDSVYISAFGVFFTLDNKDVVTVCPYDATDRGTDASQSPISYQVSGNPGSRILEIEWQNLGFYKDKTQSDYFNVQLWLFEDSGNLEIHLGSSSVHPAFTCGNETSFLFISNYNDGEEYPIGGYSFSIDPTPYNTTFPDKGITYCMDKRSVK